MHRVSVFALSPCSCGHTSTTPSVPTSPPAATTTLALPGAPASGVFLDYIAYDAARSAW
jgi:hypothetical protein